MSNSRKKFVPKVLLFNNEVAPYRLPLFEELSQHDIELTVYFGHRKSSEREWNPSLDNYSFKYEILKCIEIFSLMINYTLPLKILRHKFDVIIFSESIKHVFANFMLAILGKLTGKKVILWSATINTEYFNTRYSDNFIRRFFFKFYRLLSEIYRKLLYSFPDYFIAYGEMAKEFLHSHGIPDAKITYGTQVVPDYLRYNTKEKGNDEFRKIKPENFIILSLGYLSKRKGIHILINAFKMIQCPNAILYIVGSGEYKIRLKELAKGRSDIVFFDHVSGERKNSMFKAADIFILPTLHDEWGLVINEAMQFSLPVITTSAAGVSEVVKKYNTGIVVNENDVSELCDALQNLKNNNQMYNRMKKNTEVFARDYNIEKACATFMKGIEFVKQKKR